MMQLYITVIMRIQYMYPIKANQTKRKPVTFTVRAEA